MPTPIVTFVGGVVTDPDLRFTGSGKAVLSFRLIVKGRKRDGTEWVDGDPMFYTVTVWAPLAENVAETISKGDDVIVHGRLEPNKYTTRDGEERETLVITAEDIGVSMRWKSWTANERTERSTPARETVTSPGEPPF